MKTAHATIALALTVSLAACGVGDDQAALVASAKAYVAKREYMAATIQAKNALQKDPDNREARYLLGLASLEIGDVLSAEQHLKKAIELGHTADEVQVAFARTLLAKGETASLIRQFGDVKLSAPKAQADLLAILGTAELRSNRRAEAQAAFKQALALDATNAFANLGVARLAGAEQDWKRSAAAVEAALATAPKNTEALILKAELLAIKGENEAATKAYRAAVEASPAEISPRLSLITHLMRQRAVEAAASELEALEKLAPKDVRTLYAKSALLVEQRKWKEARETLQHVLARMPEHVPSLTMAGMAAFETGAYVEAESHLRKALFNAPKALMAKRLLAATHLRMGQTDVATTEVGELLEAAPDDPRILALAGEVRLANGDVEGAARHYERARRVAPDNVRVQTRLAQIRFAAGDESQGFAELEAAAAAATSTDEYQADLALIAAYLRQRQADKALEAVDRLEKKQPDNPVTHHLRGVALLLKKDYAKARASFERAVQLRPTYMPSVSNLARLDLREKKPEVAKKRYEAVLAKEPQNERALLGLAVLLRVTGAPQVEIEKALRRSIAANPSSPAAHLALVNFYLRARDHKGALAAAQQASVALPKEPRIVGALGVAQLAAGEKRQAVGTLTRLAEMQPKSPEPLLLLAAVHMQVEQPDEAIKALRAALELRPDLDRAHRDIVAIYAKTGRAEQALKEARAVQAEDPKRPFGYMLEAEVYVSQKNWDAAERVYRGALKKFDSPVLAARAHAVIQQAGKPKDADALAEQWIAAHPKDAFVLNYLGERDVMAKRYDSAVKRYERALERAPNNALILNNLAWLKHQLKHPGALDDAERAHELAPENAAIMDTLGTILVDSGELERGLEQLGAAAERAPQAYSIRLNFAKALLKAKRKGAARKELEMLAKLDSRNPIQQEAAKLLASL
jgi:putative PEP-CTERM system TPR-repeat lipoprotein